MLHRDITQAMARLERRSGRHYLIARYKHKCERWAVCSARLPTSWHSAMSFAGAVEELAAALKEEIDTHARRP